jgi:integrase
MTGKRRCNKDGTEISAKTGTCPKCGKIQCHIAIYWHEEVFRFYKDVNGIVFSYMSALDQLAAMNREMRAKTFKAELWQPGAVKERRLAEAADRWLAQKKIEVDQEELSYGSYHVYRSHIDNHILSPVYGLGAWDIREISYAELDEFQDNLPSHLKIKTRREIMHTLHNFLKQALKKLNRNLPPFPDPINGNDSVKRVALTVEDMVEAVRKIPAEHRDFFEFENEVGTRPGECCSLKIRDINFTDQTATIQSTFTMGKFRNTDKEGHELPIPLSPRALDIARSHAAGRFPDDYLFLHPQTKKHYTVITTAKIWNRYTQLTITQKGKTRRITHYEGTRHSFATQVGEHGGDIKGVQGLLRHKDSRSTDKYMHPRTEYLREVLQKRTNVVELNKVKNQKNKG